jgi:transcriptional regulator with XRE-family HTH domain
MKKILNGQDIAKRIKLIMAELNLNQEEFAKTIGATAAAISNYLKGRIPSADIIANIVLTAQKAGNHLRTADWLLFGEEREFQKLINSIQKGPKDIKGKQPLPYFNLYAKLMLFPLNRQILEVLDQLSNEQKQLIIDLTKQFN